MLAPYTDQGNLFPLGEMDEENFKAFFDSQKSIFEAKKAAELKAEQDRIEEERKSKILTERRIELAPYATFVKEQIDLSNITDEQYKILLTTLIKAKADHDSEQAKIKAENDRLAKEKEELEAKAEKERLEAKRIQDELEAKAKAERDKAEADAAKIKAEADKKLAEEAAKLKALQDELEAKAKAEKDRLAKEKADLEAKAEEARLALKAPLKDQLNAWIESLNINTPDNLKDNTTVIDIANKFNGFKNWAKIEINKI